MYEGSFWETGEPGKYVFIYIFKDGSRPFLKGLSTQEKTELVYIFLKIGYLIQYNLIFEKMRWEGENAKVSKSFQKTTVHKNES